jgi:hypothetical protein
MEARSQVQCTTKGNEMNLIQNLTAFSWKAMQRTASGVAIYLLRVRHPHFGCVVAFTELAVADLVSR